MPLPQLDSLESSVVEQIRELHQSFEDLAAKTVVAETDLAEAYGSLGQIYHAYEFFDAAEACYRNATRLARDDYRWLHLVGYLFQQTGRLEESVGFYTAARRARPDDHAATARLGEVYLRLNRGGDAREQFRAALARFPAVAHNGLGEAALRDGRFEEAIEHFETALQRVPEASSIHYSLAMAYRGLGRVDRARSHLQQRGQGGIRAADPIVDGLQSLVRGERANVIQGRLAYQAGQFKDAADAFARAVSAAPTSAHARVNLGSALAQLGDTEGAIVQLQTALRLDAEDVAAHLNLGTLLARQDRHAEAVDHFRAVTAVTPDDLEAHRGLARALLRLGREQEAIDVLFTVTSLDPGEEDSLLSLAILLADRTRYREARDLLDRVNRLFPDRHRTATTLARLLATSPDLGLRDGDRALELAMAVYRASPTPIHGETVAYSLAELGRCGEAADWHRRALEAATRDGDTELEAHLKNERWRYEGNPCRPKGQ